jgi:putative FmdB family regulatory protein
VPAYDYRCQDCGTRFEVRMSMAAYAEGAKPRCDACGSPRVERAFTAVSVLTGSRGSTSPAGAACGGGTRSGFS